MALNKWMHPRNPYKTPPNFKDMAIKYPEFRKVVTQDILGKIHLDFNSSISLRTLTTLLFKKDFQLDVFIPENCLIPTLPSRLNYLLWVEDLIAVSSSSQNTVRGLDIGTGASAVYPLLAVKHFNWNMVATESSEINFNHAKENIDRNSLTSKILLKRVDGSKFFDLFMNDDDLYDFSMCNPPFFNLDKEFEGESIGSSSEIITSGGEVEFVKRMIEESLVAKDRIKIFTVLLGHKSSVNQVKKILYSSSVKHITVTQFCQGKTMRWGVAWTYFSDISIDQVKGTKVKATPKPFSLVIEKSELTSNEEINALICFHKVKRWLEETGVSVQSRKETKYLCSARLTAKNKCWQKQRRKRRENLRSNEIIRVKDENTGIYGKFSEMENECESNGNLEDALMNELLSSESRSKSMKNNNSGNEIIENKNSSDSVIDIDLFIRWAGPNVKLDLCYVSGNGGREDVHQLTQYLKNKLRPEI